MPVLNDSSLTPSRRAHAPTELARWELLPRIGMLQRALKEGWIFLVVEQQAVYTKPIKPFQRFQVTSTVSAVETR